MRADQAFVVHDALLSVIGLGIIGGLLANCGPGTPTPVGRLSPGDAADR